MLVCVYLFVCLFVLFCLFIPCQKLWRSKATDFIRSSVGRLDKLASKESMVEAQAVTHIIETERGI